MSYCFGAFRCFLFICFWHWFMDELWIHFWWNSLWNWARTGSRRRSKCIKNGHFPQGTRFRYFHTVRRFPRRFILLGLVWFSLHFGCLWHPFGCIWDPSGCKCCIRSCLRHPKSQSTRRRPQTTSIVLHRCFEHQIHSFPLAPFDNRNIEMRTLRSE